MICHCLTFLGSSPGVVATMYSATFGAGGLPPKEGPKISLCDTCGAGRHLLSVCRNGRQSHIRYGLPLAFSLSLPVIASVLCFRYWLSLAFKLSLCVTASALFVFVTD
jgi:hypothetical protein